MAVISEKQEGPTPARRRFVPGALIKRQRQAPAADTRATFEGSALPWLLLTPQLLVLFIFFFWPAGKAVWQSFMLQNPFGGYSEFVGLENYTRLLDDPRYWASVRVTLVFSALTATLALFVGLMLAVFTDRVVRGLTVYRTLLMWPYAVAAAISGVLWYFIFNPQVGIFTFAMEAAFGWEWNPSTNRAHAMALVVVAAAWGQIAYNYLFFLAGLQRIPRTLVEAGFMDGAGPIRRLWDIVLPLLSPTAFFLVVMNIIFVFFDTFGVIATATGGGPAGSTTTLVYKVYKDGFVNMDIGASAAQSVLLMILVVGMTVFQFRYIERRVNYEV